MVDNEARDAKIKNAQMQGEIKFAQKAQELDQMEEQRLDKKIAELKSQYDKLHLQFLEQQVQIDVLTQKNLELTNIASAKEQQFSDLKKRLLNKNNMTNELQIELLD